MIVVIGTHVPLQGATGTVNAMLLQTKLASYSTYAVGAQIAKGLLPQASFWDTANPHFYLRIERPEDARLRNLGGADHKTGQSRDPERHYAQEKRLRQLLPQAKIDYRWSGQVVETNDGLPFIGETAPGQFVATGFSGNGMTFGTLSAMMAADAREARILELALRRESEEGPRRRLELPRREQGLSILHGEAVARKT